VNCRSVNHYRKNICLVLALIFLSGLLSSCANVNNTRLGSPSLEPPPLKSSNKGDSAADLLNRYWHVDGKLSLRSLLAEANAPSAQVLRFNWQQQAQDFSATLTGPLGFGRVNIAQKNQRIYFTKGKTHIEANDIDQLFAQQTGWDLPISYLRYWALGLPSPEQSFTLNNTVNNTNKITSFKQAGWQIHYPSITLTAPYPLPSKMIASNEYFKLTIAFKHWQFPLKQSSEVQATSTQAGTP